MKINFFKYLTLILIILISFIVYLSVIGIETEKLNGKIKDKIFEINNNFNVDLKKIKLTLDPLNFSVNVKTIGTTVYHSNKRLELEYIKSQVSLASILKRKLISSNIEIATRSILIKDLIKFVRATNNRPELFILEKIIKNGHLILDLNFSYDENGNIKNDYMLTGLLKDGKIKLFDDSNFEKIDFLFNIKKNNFSFRDIKIHN